MYLSYQRSLALISKPQISHPFSQQWRTQKKITALMLPSIVELSCSFDLRLKVAKHHFGKKNFVPDNRKDNILILVREFRDTIIVTNNKKRFSYFNDSIY